MKTKSLLQPSTVKSEYHGNGKNAWYRSEYEFFGTDGILHRLVLKSVRHSYRWHKTIRLLDGHQLLTRWDYERARKLAGESDAKQIDNQA